jgi:hypothetical protein
LKRTLARALTETFSGFTSNSSVFSLNPSMSPTVGVRSEGLPCSIIQIIKPTRHIFGTDLLKLTLMLPQGKHWGILAKEPQNPCDQVHFTISFDIFFPHLKRTLF